jgi:steroid delta-isomerase-like uncharacterized protein
MYREKNKATCRRFIQQIFNEGNISVIRDFVSPDSLQHDLEDVPAPSGRSPERMADMIQAYRHAFPDLRVQIQDQIAENDRVVTCLRMRGTQKGPLLGIGGSGKKVDVFGIRVDRLAEGKITESWFQWDGLGMLQQIGALTDLARNPEAAPRANETMSLPSPTPFPTAPIQTTMRGSSAARLKSAA